MGIAKTSLEYISLSGATEGTWVTAENSDGNDAVIMLNVEQTISASAKADIILSNRSVNPGSSTMADAKGPLSDVFAEFQRIRLVHQEIGIPIFSGRIYRIRDIYDAQYGQTIRIVAFDALKELREFPIEDAGDSLESIDTTSSNVGGYDVRKRSQVIKYMLDELNLKDKNILTTDTDHFEDSWSTDSLGDKKLNLVKLDRHVAGVMQDLAISDPVKDGSATVIGESGYDYRVEPRFVSSATNHKPIESLHYFMRGTRPGKGGAYGNAAAPVLTTTAHSSNALLTDSLTIEYTNEDSVVDSGIKQTMMPQYEFDKPKSELYTSVVCHYTDDGKEDAGSNDETGGKTEGVVTFEFLKGSALSGTFTWASKALDINKKGVVNVPEYLTHGGNNVAVVQWQNTAKKYLMISHIDEATFPTTGVVTLTGASSGETFVFNAATDRMKTKYGVERPLRIQRTLTSNLGMIRDEIVSRLVGRTDLEIVRGKFNTVKYPIVYHDLVNTADPPTTTASRSGNTITWTGAIAARDRGIRKGHIVAEINSLGQYVRYAYISAVTNDRSINYGASATDTSDGTALDASAKIRLIIPLRPGDIVKVVNKQSGVDTDQVLLSLGYDESPGMFAARYETVGSNNKFNNMYQEGEDLRTSIAAAAPKKFPNTTQALSETSFFFNGFINRGSNASDANDYRKIHWSNTSNATSGTAGTLTVGDGAKYTIACANSSTLTTAEHTIFFRHAKSKATTNKSDTTFQIVLTTNYTKDADDILIGWCKASAAQAGSKAVLVLAPQFSSKDLFASGQNGTLTEALLSKSAQEYSSGLEITALTSGSNKHLQVTWAACTATSGSSASPDDRLTFGDGDVWILAAKDGSNYSVTTNGTSYSNITALTHSSTYYAFVDTADTASGGTLTLRFTTKYAHISTADDGTFSSSRVIMAQIAVPANGDDGAAPRVFPFNNRSLTINAASIAADAITATHITAGAISTGKLTTALQGNITEKTITTVASSAPTNPAPRTNDIWFDTSGTPTVIKVYDSTTSPYWFERNSNDSGSTLFKSVIGSPPTASAINDLWYTTDTHQIYIAFSATADEIAANEWVLKNDADAINYAQTEINGGLIKTQRIKLLEGGSLNIAAAGNAFETTVGTPVTTSRLLNDSGGISAADTSIIIDAQTTSDTDRDLTGAMTNEATDTTLEVDSQTGSELSIDVGDIVKIGSEEMLVLTIVTTTTVYTVTRGWRETTIASHSSGASVHKYVGKFIMAGDVLRIGSEDMSVTSVSTEEGVTVGTVFTVIRGWNNTVAAIHADNAAISKYLHSLVGMSSTHIILDNTGITGYSDAFTPEFSLSSVTGKGVFGGGACSLASNGLHIGGASNTAINYKFGGGDNGWIQSWANYSSGRRILYFRSIDENSGALTDPENNYLAPQSPGVMGLGHESLGPWGTIYANIHYLDIKTTSEGSNLASKSGWGAMYIKGTDVWVKIGGTEYVVSGNPHNHSNYGDIFAVNITAGAHLSGTQLTSTGTHTQTIDHLEANGSWHLPINGGQYQLLGYYASGRAQWVDPGDHGIHEANTDTCRVNTGSTSKFAYYSGSTAISPSTGNTATLYCNGQYTYSSYVYMVGLASYSGGGVDLIDYAGQIARDTSSSRYKENIVDLAVDTSKIYELVPKTYKAKDSERPTVNDDGEPDFDTMETIIGETTFGLIAEEVHEILPELVIYNKDNEPDAIRYKTIAVLLIEEMKKLRARIEVLEGV